MCYNPIREVGRKVFHPKHGNLLIGPMMREFEVSGEKGVTLEKYDGKLFLLSVPCPA